MAAGTSVDSPPRWADRIGRTLLALDAASTIGFAFVDGIRRVTQAADAQVMMEFWVTTAYLVFAGLWAILAWAPRRYRGIWELILIQKIAVTAFAWILIDKPDAVRNTISDTSLVVTTIVAYVLCRGWYTWRKAAANGPGAGHLAPTAG
jgi:hypothetical protein